MGDTVDADPPSEAEDVIPRWTKTLPHLRILGLMTMTPLVGAEACRPFFQELRELRDRVAASLSPAVTPQFRELSMGLSNDYPVAVEEGATWIRLGRVLFE